VPEPNREPPHCPAEGEQQVIGVNYNCSRLILDTEKPTCGCCGSAMSCLKKKMVTCLFGKLIRMCRALHDATLTIVVVTTVAIVLTGA